MTHLRAGDLEGSVDALASTALTLAQRFAAGATLWCVAPRAPHHARHVAVEFVHPVIVGTRSLPAVAVEAPDPVAALRGLVRAGDVVLTIGAEDDPVIADLARRAEPWGAASIVIVTAAERDAVPDADGDADVVMAYHLLWELTHVVFGHPGLLVPPVEVCDAQADVDGAGVCITCSDDAQLAEVRTILDPSTVVAVTAGEHVEIDVSLVGPLAPGDLVLAHAGLALTVLGEPTAASEEYAHVR